ncbi:MAG: TIGR00159 family protein [Dehalococcoidia bacterium]|nr:TIGR00159 family protein [Dehalococcoidia bacterium]
MAEALGTLIGIAGSIDLRSVVDILLVALVLYSLLLLLRGTTAMSLLRAIVVVYVAGFALSYVLQLTMVGWLLRNSFPAMLVAIPILFQPELRRVLEQVGRGFGISRLTGRNGLDGSAAVDAVARACLTLGQRHVGALIVLERATGLQEYVDQGFLIDAVVSPELLLALFATSSPFHDGAVVIRRGRIVAARCVMPLSDNPGPHVALGTRHRAAAGISEQTDAIAIAVSEERGSTSLAVGGRMVTFPPGENIRSVLAHHFASREPAAETPAPEEELTRV